MRVASKTPERARAFAEREAKRHGIAVTPCATVREAVEGADIVCTATSSREPVVLGEWLSPGAHVNAVGSSVAAARELDTAAVARSRFFVDRRESALAEAGDFLLARTEGAVGDAHIAGELGEVLVGAVRGPPRPRARSRCSSRSASRSRTSRRRSTSTGRRAESGIGRFLELGGGRHDAD